MGRFGGDSEGWGEGCLEAILDDATQDAKVDRHLPAHAEHNLLPRQEGPREGKVAAIRTDVGCIHPGRQLTSQN